MINRKLNLEQKRKMVGVCFNITFVSMTLSLLIGVISSVFQLEIMDSIFEIPMIIISSSFLISLLGIINYLYEINPDVQLRGKDLKDLQEVLKNDDLKYWHPKAIEKIKKITSCSTHDKNL